MEFFAGLCFGAIIGVIFIMAVFHYYEKKAAKVGYINHAGKMYTLTPTSVTPP